MLFMDKINRVSWHEKSQYTAQTLIIGLAFIIPISTSLTTILMMLILLTWLLSGDLKNKMQFYFTHPLSVSILLLLGLSLMGMLYTTASLTQGLETTKEYLRLAYIPVLMFYLRESSVQKNVAKAFVLAMVVTLILGYLKVYAHVPIGLKYTMGAVFKSHIKTSYLMAIAAFILSIYAYQNPKHRLIIGVVVIAMLYYLFFMSFGRIGHLTVLLLGLAWGWYHCRLKGILIMLGSLLVLLAITYATSDVFAQRVDILEKDWIAYQKGGKAVAESSMGSRAMFYKTSTLIFLQHPLIGVGTGGFEKAYTDYYVGQNISLLTDNPHNQYLKIMVELGVLGLLALFWLLYQPWRLSYQYEKEHRLLIQGILLSFYAGCLLNTWLCDFVESYFYLIFCATAFASVGLKEAKSVIKAASWLRVAK